MEVKYGTCLYFNVATPLLGKHSNILSGWVCSILVWFYPMLQTATSLTFSIKLEVITKKFVSIMGINNTEVKPC